jgi:hypothetical protein
MVLGSSQMLLATTWTDLVVHEVCFVVKMIEIKKNDTVSVKLAR